MVSEKAWQRWPFRWTILAQRHLQLLKPLPQLQRPSWRCSSALLGPERRCESAKISEQIMIIVTFFVSLAAGPPIASVALRLRPLSAALDGAGAGSDEPPVPCGPFAALGVRGVGGCDMLTDMSGEA